MKFYAEKNRAEPFYKYWTILKQLENAGFRQWMHQGNPNTMWKSRYNGIIVPYAYELFYINTRYIL